jgi:hypothetical protein
MDIKPIDCPTCGDRLGYTPAKAYIPQIYCSVPCADGAEYENTDRDDLIALLHRDLGFSPTQIVMRLEGRYELSRQHVWQILSDQGVLVRS